MKARKYIDETNNLYGYLKVISYSHYRNGMTYWNCLCTCGKTKEIKGSHLRLGKTRSCGCQSARPTKVEEPHKRVYRAIRNGAKSRDMSFDISFEDFVNISRNPCAYCGLPPYDIHYAYSKKRYSRGISADVSTTFNGLDRVDSSLGYFLENVVSCCFMCNRMKSDFSLEEFLKKIEEVYLHHAKISINKKSN